ncbi:hypothetical protein [Fluviibacter phosphoraccumulans]|jgi:hypothetical protein|uniref:Uncharacterized protein n=1 Tax=Fluviibacter phosphoraccumulans TaxID=1751046 RepID=A0A679HSB0_9RHOO|nr:hypothetical protein [Fluviibacter phosphoraccumulans]BBU69202.1 hypothetical protein ICHIAU1_14850 [Fluviibacter phosphoraccumulans]BBU71643.1 hypothetical protein ICHIJ1_15620 [Fluviibacter phosphoraccumulans]BCA65136.1 hypothetical protein SHINM1_007380 [Fluviibacter phosphoraccumulans]
MLPNTHASLTTVLDDSAIADLNHVASASLNSLEYLTAVALGLAQEGCNAAAKEGASLLAAQSPWDMTLYLSRSPANLMSDFSKRCLKLQEIAQNYYDYVNSDFPLMH